MFRKVSSDIDFIQMEKKIFGKWYSSGIINDYLHLNDQSDKKFSFLDGPITANNPMGVHHAWGRTYKDLWQRFFNMLGYKQRFQNGFDCQGLWVEVEVEKELKIRNKKDIENLIPGNKKASIAKFVQLCKERVKKYSSIQTEQSKKLGYFMDWDNSYYTMSDENNYLIWYFLKTCYQKGWIYKGFDSVPWCPRCETAISQHEMLTEDYKELTHETVFLKLKINDSSLSQDAHKVIKKFKHKFKNIYLLVWTTTPWTIPANVAVGINTKFTYGIWEHKGNDEAVIILEKDENLDNVKRISGNKEISMSEYIFSGIEGEFEKKEEVSGTELVGLHYNAPFDSLPLVKNAGKEKPNTFHTVVDGSEIVVSDEGTGLLHVAPGAGKEDFDLGKREDLPIISVITDNATYMDSMGEFSGKNAKKHPEIIIDYLRNYCQGEYLLKTMYFKHRYPSCWRCKTELVWKVTHEWYIAMDRKEKLKVKEGKTLRQQMVKTAKMIRWMPEFGLDRELDWLKNMNDWLISKKNRYWGLALPIYECNKCGNFEVIGSFEELKNRAVLGWEKFKGNSPHKPFIDEVMIECSKCKEKIGRIDDVGNVWLDAGSVPFSTYIDPKTKKLSYTSDKEYWREWFPADFITESFPGQFKNWFYSMIAMSTVLEKRNPYNTVLGYASMLGEDGRPMHKSWGNAIEFNEGADKIGVDVMRWIFVTQDPEQNIHFGFRKADETRRKFHLILWNVYNFFVTYANLAKWDSKNTSRSNNNYSNILDKWIISLLNQLIGIVEKSLNDFDSFTAAASIESFVIDLSQWYIRRSRDRVSIRADNQTDKDQCLEVIYEILVTLSKLLAPFIPYLPEEIFTSLTGEKSVHLAKWPITDDNKIDTSLMKQMVFARKLVESGHSLRKEYKIKTRQPLSSAWHSETSNKLENEKVLDLVLQELNVHKWIVKKDSNKFIKKPSVVSKNIDGFEIFLDINIDKDLLEEGQVRDIIRQIQIKRKELGCDLAEKIDLVIPKLNNKYFNLIQRETIAGQIIQGEELKVIRK